MHFYFDILLKNQGTYIPRKACPIPSKPREFPEGGLEGKLLWASETTAVGKAEASIPLRFCSKVSTQPRTSSKGHSSMESCSRRPRGSFSWKLTVQLRSILVSSAAAVPHEVCLTEQGGQKERAVLLQIPQTLILPNFCVFP